MSVCFWSCQSYNCNTHYYIPKPATLTPICLQPEGSVKLQKTYTMDMYIHIRFRTLWITMLKIYIFVWFVVLPEPWHKHDFNCVPNFYVPSRSNGLQIRSSLSKPKEQDEQKQQTSIEGKSIKEPKNKTTQINKFSQVIDHPALAGIPHVHNPCTGELHNHHILAVD